MKEYQRRSLLEAMDKFGYCEVQAYGQSMRPCIKDGDKVRISREFKCLKTGDIAACFIDNQLVIHRIIGFVNTGSLKETILRGDAYPGTDIRVKYSDIVGKIRIIIDGKWYQNLLLRSRLRFFLIPFVRLYAHIRYIIC